MSDIVERLRAWDHCWPARWLEDAVPEAAAEIARLRAEVERKDAALLKVRDTSAQPHIREIANLALTGATEKSND